MPYKRGKRWVANPHDPDVKRKVHVGTFDTKREARDAEHEYLASKRQRRAKHGRETCDEFSARWLEDYPRAKASTQWHNEERLKKFAGDFKGVRLADLDRLAARRWALENRGRVAAVRAMFNDAVREGATDVNPFAGLRLPQSRGRKDIVALTEPELTHLADQALKLGLGDFGREYRAMILFAGYTGVRPGELFALEQDDIRGDYLNVERAVIRGRGGDTVGRPKNGKSRTIVIPPPAREALKDVSLKVSGLLFESPRGHRWTTTSNTYYWQRARLLAGRPDLAFYVLRHSAATMLLERGVTPWDVGLQLGHQDGGILVMELYGHPDHANARGRLLAAYGQDGAPGVTPLSSKRAVNE